MAPGQRRDHALAAQIAERHGFSARSVRPIVGAGSVNHVFVVDEVVVRFAVDDLRNHDFETEKWASDRAREVGVPTPEVLAHGHLDEVGYGVQRFSPGAAPGPDDARLWQQTGRWAQLICGIALDHAPASVFSRFGRDLTVAWQSHVDYNLDALGPADRLVALGVIERGQVPQLRARFAELRDANQDLGLFHGDLRPANVLLDGEQFVLLDWGGAATGPVGWHELNGVRQMVVNGEAPAWAPEAFAEAADLLEIWRDRRRFESYRLLEAVDLVRWTLDRRPDLTDEYVGKARATVVELGV